MNNTHVKQFTEKKTQRFICIQQVLCRNTIRPWRFVQGQLLKKCCQGDKRAHGHFKTQIVLLSVYAVFHLFIITPSTQHENASHFNNTESTKSCFTGRNLSTSRSPSRICLHLHTQSTRQHFTQVLSRLFTAEFFRYRTITSFASLRCANKFAFDRPSYRDVCHGKCCLRAERNT